MIKYGKQNINSDDIDAVIDVLKSEFLTQGPCVPAFENAVSAYCGSHHAVAVNSATSALHIACLALGVRSGDTVWTSPNTFVASANCALYCGAKIDFVDIDPVSYNISVDRLEEKLAYSERVGSLPKVIIVVHYAGQPCQMHEIRVLADKYGVYVIEDASHALGAEYRVNVTQPGREGHSDFCNEASWTRVGSCSHSDITVFSFHPVKIITTMEGGLATTNSSHFAELMRRYRNHGIIYDEASMAVRPKNEIWNYQQVVLGFNYRMTDVQAALGLSQMKRLDAFVERRRYLAKLYDEQLSSLSIILPVQRPENRSSYHLYPVRIREALCGKKQRDIYESLRDFDIVPNLHYIPVHRHPFYEAKGFKVGDYPEAERFFQEAISLPLHFELSDNDITHVVKSLLSLNIRALD